MSVTTPPSAPERPANAANSRIEIPPMTRAYSTKVWPFSSSRTRWTSDCVPAMSEYMRFSIDSPPFEQDVTLRGNVRLLSRRRRYLAATPFILAAERPAVHTADVGCCGACRGAVSARVVWRTPSYLYVSRIPTLRVRAGASAQGTESSGAPLRLCGAARL